MIFLSSPAARLTRALTIGLSAIALTACSTLGTYVAPQAQLPAAYTQGSSGPADNRRVEWWLAFRDQRLNRLIERGLAQNLDLAQAVERINQARAGITAAGGSHAPSMTATAGAALSDPNVGPVVGSALAGANASWLVGLFGQMRLSQDAARANLDAAYFSAGVARLAFLSEIATAYVDLRFYQESLALTRAELTTRKETLALTESLFADGGGSRLDVLQAQGALDSASLAVPRLELGFIRAMNRLATLTAQSPATLEADMQAGAPQPWPQLRLSAGVPADLVRTRPDIQAAERLLAAATAEVGLAEAALYPSLTLAGNIQLVGIASGAAGTWTFGPTLNLPFLDGGRSEANHQVALSKVNQAYNAWHANILIAVEEVENAIAAVRRDGRTIDAAQRVVATASQALELSRQSYQLGQLQILDVLTSERNLFEARAGLAEATQQLARNFIVLNVAVGSGVEAAR